MLKSMQAQWQKAIGVTYFVAQMLVYEAFGVLSEKLG